MISCSFSILHYSIRKRYTIYPEKNHISLLYLHFPMLVCLLDNFERLESHIIGYKRVSLSLADIFFW